MADEVEQKWARYWALQNEVIAEANKTPLGDMLPESVQHKWNELNRQVPGLLTSFAECQLKNVRLAIGSDLKTPLQPVGFGFHRAEENPNLRTTYRNHLTANFLEKIDGKTYNYSVILPLPGSSPAPETNITESVEVRHLSAHDQFQINVSKTTTVAASPIAPASEDVEVRTEGVRNGKDISASSIGNPQAYAAGDPMVLSVQKKRAGDLDMSKVPDIHRQLVDGFASCVRL
jgi:hypothetical protein